MRIQLEYPYNTKWKNGYLVTNSESMRTIILFNSSTDRTSTSYARYLMSVKLGRFLTKNEEVDHIDHDKTNDCIGNLQVVSKNENLSKEMKRRGRLMVEIVCPVCNTIFIRKSGNTQVVKSLAGKVTCCSRGCSNVFSKLKLKPDERLKISTGSVKRVFKVYE